MLQLSNLTWAPAGGSPVLQGVNLTAKTGKLTAITGPNGGGKTTLLRLVAGIMPPTSGRICLNGEDITALDVTSRARRGVSLAFQQPVSFKGLQVGRLLELAAGRPLEKEEAAALLSQVGLPVAFAARPADATLSGGERKRVELATVLARPGRLLLFDEPEAGIDLWGFSGLLSVFQALRAAGDKALLLITHQQRILEIADEVYILAEGKVRPGTASGPLPAPAQPTAKGA